MVFREEIILAIKSVAYMFLMPLSGVMCFSFLIALYHSLFTDVPYGFYTGSFFSDGIAALATGYAFYFAVTESFKIKHRLARIRDNSRKR